MKRWIIPLMLGFGVTLALLIGQRMSTDAMAVVVGVAVGVAASVPTSLLLVALLRRDRRSSWQGDRREMQPYQGSPYNQYQQYPPQPPVIVINPGDMNGRGFQQYTPLPPPADFQQDGGLRRLRVVGDDEDWVDDRW